MRDFLYSEISQIERIPNIPNNPDLAIKVGKKLCVEMDRLFRAYPKSARKNQHSFCL